MTIKSIAQNATQVRVAEVALALSQNPADELGLLKAKIASDLKRIKQLEDEFKAKGAGVYNGVVYSATVSETAGRETLIREQVEKFLSPQQLRASIKVGEAGTRLTVSAISAAKAVA